MSTGRTKRLIIVGLGNYTHPLTRHSIGQLLLKNLAKRALSEPRSQGSSNFNLSRFGRNHQSWTTKITIPSPTSSSTNRPGDEETGGDGNLELLFVLPRSLMNILGSNVVATCQDVLRIPSTPLFTPSTPSIDSPLPLDETLKQSPQRRKKNPSIIPLKPMYNLLTLSDDLDLPPSQLKPQRGGGPRGHNGVRSIISSLFHHGNKCHERDFHRLWIGIGRPSERSRVSRYVLEPLGREEARSVEWDEERGVGGEVLERAWKEVLKISEEL